MSIGSGTTSFVFIVDGPRILLVRLGFIVVGEHKNYTAQVFQLDLRPEEQTWIYNNRWAQELQCTRGASVSPQITEWNLLI